MIMQDVVVWYRNHRRACVIAAVVVATLVAMILRRPDQWAAPYLWIEEGSVMLPDFAATGWRTLFNPVNGYLLLPTKLILATSATLSFRWLPEIEYWLTLAFTALVLAAVALSPTTLKYRLACALALLALPTDAEVYAMSSLAFWWGSLLVILPLLWRRDAAHHFLRGALIVLGGLSSPLVLVLSPLYLVRAAWLRTRAAFADLGLVIVVTGIQASSVFRTAQTTNDSFRSLTPGMFVRKFFGYFIDAPAQFATHDATTLLAGLALALAFAVVAVRWRRELGTAFFVVMGVFVLASIASSLRVPLVQLHPALAGPRYFFVPFAMLFWATLQLCALNAAFPRVIAIAILALVLRTTLDVGRRDSDRLDWRANVAACLLADRHEFPIGFDGRAIAAWKLQMSGSDCRRLVAASWFANELPDAAGAR